MPWKNKKTPLFQLIDKPYIGIRPTLYVRDGRSNIGRALQNIRTSGSDSVNLVSSEFPYEYSTMFVENICTIQKKSLSL